jgi:hypothetical protein
MKIYLDTIGCRLNQSEIESMARGFRAAASIVEFGQGEAGCRQYLHGDQKPPPIHAPRSARSRAPA